MKMRNLLYKIGLLVLAMAPVVNGQEYRTAVQEFKVDPSSVISIEASYAEIEIQEWSKNRVEVEGIMSVQGLPEKEAQAMFDSWNIKTQQEDKKVTIRSKGNGPGSEYFFINSDKYIGNVMVDIPKITARALDAIDSVHFILPEYEFYADMNFDFDFDFDEEAMQFDYQAYKKDSEAYMKEWKERNKEQLQAMKEHLKENEERIREHTQKIKEEQQRIKEEQKRMHEKEVQRQKELHQEREKQMREREREMARREVEMKERRQEMEERAQEREVAIRRIMEDRQKVKVKRKLRIRVPRNARLELDVDYCKISKVQ